jgi:hypothetical protein
VGWHVVMNPKTNSGKKSQGRTNKMPWNRWGDKVGREEAKMLHIKNWSKAAGQE